MAAATASLAPAGSSSYSSDILHVGDGTWDAGRDDFLLPNLVGLPFDVMRYNGMGNRFRNLAEYHTLILGHAILAAITFLFVLPAAIFTAKFYHRDPHVALRTHISLNSFSVILVTIVFILGYFAVGPTRSLTNPHHGIGLALYVLILFQVIGGFIVRRIERKKVRYWAPVKLMLHQWLGRAIALLGFSQVALGLTLYGSPKALFVLYALWGSFLVVLYFVLTYQTNKRHGMGLDEGSSYVTGTNTEVTQQGRRRRFSGLEKAAGAMGLIGAVEAIRRRSSGRHRRGESESAMLSDRPGSSRFDEGNAPPPHGARFDDKFTDSRLTDGEDERHGGNWRNRLLGGAAAVGGVAAMRRLFTRRRRDEDYQSDVSAYSRPAYSQGPNNSSVVRVNDMEEGHPLTYGGQSGPNTGFSQPQVQGPYMAGAMPPAPNNDGRWRQREQHGAAQQTPMSNPGLESRVSGDSYADYDDQPRRGRFGGLLGGLGGLAALGGMRNYFRRRRHQPDDDFDQPEDGHNTQYNQPGTPGRPNVPYTDDSPRRPNQQRVPQPPSTTDHTDFAQAGAAGPSLLSGNLQNRPPPMNIPQPPRTANMGPPPPVHSDFTSTSPTSYASPSRSNRARRFSAGNRSNNIIHEPLGGPNAGTSAGDIHSPPPPPPPMPAASAGRSRAQSQDSAGVESPPVSVKVKMHNNGRHVTLRRLSEEEAAREREARRQERAGAGPSSAQAPYPTGPTRPVAANPNLAAPSQAQPGSSISPPSGLAPVANPISPLASSAGGSRTQGGDVAEWEASRRRRRAERARLQEREREGGGRRVEFT